MAMMSDWQAFLQQAGATISDGTVNSFGDPAAEQAAAVEADVITDLGRYGLIRIEGADAANFLQGQLSNDIRAVTAGASQLAAYCTPKGRALSTARLFLRDGAYWLRLPAALAATTADRLRKYILMSKVTLTLAEEELVGVGVAGPGAPAWLTAQTGAAPEAVDEVAEGGDYTLIRIPGATPRFEIYAPLAAMERLWRAAGGFRPVGAPAWELLDIRAGIGDVLPATAEAFVPQMLNLHLINGVSFQKGCYPGQEIVARMQYLGKLKRRMYRARVETDEIPPAGTELFSAASESGQGTGRVVSAQPSPAGGCELLAVIERATVDNGKAIHLADTDGPVLAIEPLPYAFPPDAEK